MELVRKRVEVSFSVDDQRILEIIDEIILEFSKGHYISFVEKQKLRRDIFNGLRRYDVLQNLLEDDMITEIMVNGAFHIFIEKEGRLEETEIQFESQDKLNDVIQQIVSKSNRIINESTPIVDARLEDGSRVNVVLPPVAVDGAMVTIRKFPKHPITMENLIQMNAITQEVAEFLRDLVVAGYNIFVSGGTGSGKTTFLNVLSNYIPATERIITIEDSAELQIKNIPNIVRLEVKNTNIEGKNGISIRDLIKTSLRMRPDRILVGEVRDEAAIDMLQAFNTGHEGSLSTGHANSPKDMLNRLETLVLMGTDMPLLAARKLVASAIDIIVHLGRLRDRSRKVLEIVEVLDCEDSQIKLNPLYRFEERNQTNRDEVVGELLATGSPLRNQQKLKKAGLHVL